MLFHEGVTNCCKLDNPGDLTCARNTGQNHKCFAHTCVVRRSALARIHLQAGNHLWQVQTCVLPWWQAACEVLCHR
jgi:hypothetical protein